MSEKLSNYKGSEATAKLVRTEILKRYGEEQANQYDAYTNCLSFKRWIQLGYKVRKGEKSIRSITFVDKKDALGNKLGSYRKTVHLFYKLQVDPVKQ